MNDFFYHLALHNDAAKLFKIKYDFSQKTICSLTFVSL